MPISLIQLAMVMMLSIIISMNTIITMINRYYSVRGRVKKHILVESYININKVISKGMDNFFAHFQPPTPRSLKTATILSTLGSFNPFLPKCTKAANGPRPSSSRWMTTMTIKQSKFQDETKLKDNTLELSPSKIWSLQTPPFYIKTTLFMEVVMNHHWWWRWWWSCCHCC